MADKKQVLFKHCFKCKEIKPANEFYKNKISTDGLQSSCKNCCKTQNDLYFTQYYHDNPDKMRERRRKQRGLYKHKTYKKSQIARRAGEARRRAREVELGGDFDTWDMQQCLEYWDYRCAICGRPEGLWHTIVGDHWIALKDPRSDNPGNVAWNIVPMCHAKKGSNGLGGCNNSKNDKDPEQWLIETFGKRKAKIILTDINAYFAPLKHMYEMQDKIRRFDEARWIRLLEEYPEINDLAPGEYLVITRERHALDEFPH